MRYATWAIWFVVLTVGAAAAAEPSATTLRVQHCLVSLIQDVQVPAQEAGVLTGLLVKEGDQVQGGALLGRINDIPSLLEKRVALAERAESHERATNDVAVRNADAARKFATIEYNLNHEANLKVPGAKSAVDLHKMRLAIEQATLEMEKGRHEQVLASIKTEGNTAKVELADDQIERRQIRSPIGGQVVEVLLHPGEWAKPGDPVLRIIRMDRLRVEGFLNVAQSSPSEIAGRPVQVTVRLARGQSESFTGRITFIDPRVQAGGEYRFWAEVDNRMVGDHWLLRPGLDAELSIDASHALASSN